MGSDRARISFDWTRDYRMVIAQQGRVTLEADINEASTIASEALRLETIDIIGPAGTPDNGYEVAVGADGQLAVGAGIMYVGGWRMELPSPVPLASQPDWLDQPPAAVKGDALAALLVVEQSVSAVEDQALREVALGGPDTAARMRLMQHFVQIATNGDTCAAASETLARSLESMGLALDPATLELSLLATLQVSFYPPAAPADPCCPEAQGGYLGADNQLVRVTVLGYDPLKKSGTLLWGWNNASFLYRASLVDPAAAPQILTLNPAPVDPAHSPQPGQAIEVLRTTAELGNPDDANYVAAPEGSVFVLGAGSVFDPDSNQLTLPTGQALPTAYQDDKNPLFVRLWEAQVTFTSGQPVQLDSTSGLAVTIDLAALPVGALEARPFWHFAVRPNTPQQVYPQRYLEGLQPPDGPRRWLCDLAIVGPIPGAAQWSVLANCRIPFQPLTGSEAEGCCCGITLGVDEVTARGGLQAVVDAQAAKQQPLSLRPGNYVLDAPLALTRVHAGFTLSGCGAGVALSANPKTVSAFLPGLITLTSVGGVSLRDLVLTLPVYLFTPAADAGAPADQGVHPALATLVGVRADNAVDLTITGCAFNFHLPKAGAGGDAQLTFGAGVLGLEDCTGLKVLDSTFQCPTGGVSVGSVVRMLFGILITPVATGSGGESTNDVTAQSITSVPTLNAASISGNSFTAMTTATLAIAQLGFIRCNDNRVQGSCGGFLLVESDIGSNAAMLRSALEMERQTPGQTGVASVLRQAVQPTVLANVVQYAAKLQPAAVGNALAATASAKLSVEARRVLAADYTTRGSAAFTTLAKQAVGAPATPGAAAPALDDAKYKANLAALELLQNVGIQVEAFTADLEPDIALRNNDLALVAPTKPTDGTSTAGVLGVLVLLQEGSDQGSVFVSGNRIDVPNGSSIALSVLWAADTLVTANLCNQAGVQVVRGAAFGGLPCVLLVADTDDALMVMANIVRVELVVLPPRTVPSNVLTNGWDFLNTTG